MIAIIETTVNVPTNLLEFANNFKAFGHRDILFLIIGDVKSPDDEIEHLAAILRGDGFQAEYWSIDRQRKLGGSLVKRTPLNSGRRRNIGTLLALRNCADWAIYLDDDNHPTEEDFIRVHTATEHDFLSSTNRWFDTGMLCETRVRVSLRGFPLSKRFEGKIGRSNGAKTVANQGLCLETPDVDAMTHLTLSEGAIRCKRVIRSWGVEPGTFIPMNSQNTAISGRALSSYYLPELGRNTDIIAGYILQKAAHSMGNAVSVGKPCTRHTRNKHDFMSDMEDETPSFRLIENMLPILEGEDIKASSYLECYVKLVEKLSGVLPQEVQKDMLAWSEDIA